MYGPTNQKIILSTFIRLHAKIFTVTAQVLSFILFCFEIGSDHTSPDQAETLQVEFELVILLPFPPRCWGCSMCPCSGQCWVLMAAFKVSNECAFERGRDSHTVLTQLHPYQVCVLQAHTHRPYTNCPSQILASCTFSALCSTAVTMVRTTIQHSRYSSNNQSPASSIAGKYIQQILSRGEKRLEVYSEETLKMHF